MAFTSYGPEFARMLLLAGADPNIRTTRLDDQDMGQTPLSWTLLSDETLVLRDDLLRNRLKMAQLLIANGTNVRESQGDNDFLEHLTGLEADATDDAERDLILEVKEMVRNALSTS